MMIKLKVSFRQGKMSSDKIWGLAEIMLSLCFINGQSNTVFSKLPSFDGEDWEVSCGTRTAPTWVEAEALDSW